MRRILPAVAAAALAFLSGCAGTTERVVYVPSINNTGSAVGDPLGLALVRRSNPALTARAGLMPNTTARRSEEVWSQWRPGAEENIRTPLVTFAPTDGPSPD